MLKRTPRPNEMLPPSKLAEESHRLSTTQAGAVDPLAHTLITLKQASRLIPGRTGKGIAITTVFRWSLKGCRGQKLPTILIGGVRYTSREALNLFIGAINHDAGQLQLRQKPGGRGHDVDAALDRAGF